MFGACPQCTSLQFGCSQGKLSSSSFQRKPPCDPVLRSPSCMSVLRSFLRSSGCRSLLFKPVGFPCSLQIRASLAVQSLGAETADEAVPSGTLDRDADSSSVSTLEREAAETTARGLEDAADASSSAAALDARVLREEVAKRRNFAIISHPDAGKTTLTEKLLLFGGAIHEVGTSLKAALLESKPHVGAIGVLFP